MIIELFILGLLQAFFCGINIIIFFSKYRSTSNKMLLLIVLEFAIISINAIVIVFISFYNQPTNESYIMVYILYQLIGATGMASFFLTYLFLELLNHDRPQISTLLYFTSIFSGYFFLAFSSSNYKFYFDTQVGLYNFQYASPVQITMMLFIASVFFYYVKVLWTINQISDHPFQKRVIKMFLGGLFIIIGGLVLSGLLNHREYMTLFNSFGLLLIGYSLYRYPNIVFLDPNDLFYLIVTNEDGLTLYSQEFQEAFINVEDDLVGGALNALSSLFMEILDQKQRFNHIKMENRVILFQTIKKVSVVLIVRRSSFLLQHTLYAFTSAIIDKYGTILENWGGDLSVFDGLEGLIEKYFPFVNIK